MIQNTNPLKKLSLLGLAVLALLLIGGIISYKERLFFGDAAHIAYNVLRYNKLLIQEHRLGSFITQMVPLILSRMHLPVGTILIAYTLSFNIFYLFVGCVIYRCRQYGLLIVMALTYTLFISDTYYWTNNEIHTALAWMFLFYAIIFRMGELKTAPYFLYPAFIVLAVITVYTHFIVIIPMIFLWIYFWLGKINWRWSKRTSILLTILLGIIIGSKFVFVGNTSYDEQHLHNITHTSLNDFYALAHSNVLKKFAADVWVLYTAAPVVFIIGIVVLKRRSEKALLTWAIISFIGYLMLMGLTYTNDYGAIPRFYIESEWESIAVIMAIPFVYNYLPAIKPNKALVILLIIFVVRGIYIVESYQKFAWRITAEEKILAYMQKQRINKLGLVVPDEVKKKFMLDWAVPEEAILMSAMLHESPQRTFCIIASKDKYYAKKFEVQSNVYFNINEHGTDNQNRYFRYDTTDTYTIVDYKSIFEIK